MNISNIRLGFFPLLAVFLLLVTLPSDAQQRAGQWQLSEGDEHPTMRHENAYAAANGKLYLIGGRGERPVEEFDPATGEWEKQALPPLPMHHFQAVSLDNKIYVIGAFTGGYPSEKPIPNVYIYDPKANSWTKETEIPEERRRGAAAAVAYNGKIYIAGGIQNGHASGQVRWLDKLNPETGEWKKLADAPRRRDHFQAGVIKGKLYAAGGRRSSQATGANFELTIPEVDVYDFTSNTWAPLPPSGDLPTERAGATSIVAGNSLIVLGGESGAQTEAHSEVEAFSPETGRWKSLPSLNQGRHGTQAVVMGNKIYIAAGSKVRGAEEINSQEVFVLPDSLAN